MLLGVPAELCPNSFSKNKYIRNLGIGVYQKYYLSQLCDADTIKYVIKVVDVVVFYRNDVLLYLTSFIAAIHVHVPETTIEYVSPSIMINWFKYS